MIANSVIALLIGFALGIGYCWLRDRLKRERMLRNLRAASAPQSHTQMVDAAEREKRAAGMDWLRKEGEERYGPKLTAYQRRREGFK